MTKDLDANMDEEITIPAQHEAIPRVVEFVSSYAREAAFKDERIDRIRLGLEEALGNIIRFACPEGSEEIKVTCAAHEMGAILLNIIDTGMPFNMLVMSAFPEVAEVGPDQIPSTKAMKRAVRDIEYRRDGAERKNILAWVISQ